MSNLWRTIKFIVEGETFERTLVREQKDFTTEISLDSPVGQGLMTARKGNHFTARIKGIGEVEVQVIDISETLKRN